MLVSVGRMQATALVIRDLSRVQPSTAVVAEGV